MIKKYEFTDETISHYGITLHRIRALIDFGNVKAGDLGGFIEKESNLDPYGNAWVYDNAEVYGDAKVYGNAWVYDNAKVYGNAEVYGNAKVSGDAEVYGNAKVSGDAKVYGNAWVSGNAEVYGNAWVYDNAKVSGNAWVSSQFDIYTVSNIGSRNATTTFMRTKDNGIFVVCGCYCGLIDDFEKRVNEVHGDSIHGRDYRHAIAGAHIHMDDRIAERKGEE